MQRVYINLIANLVGRGGSIILSFTTLPIFVTLLSAEAYGLVGLYASILAVFSVLDLGISALLIREAARKMPSAAAPSPELGDLFRTLEMIAFGFFVLVTLGALLWLPGSADRLVNAQTLSAQEVLRSVQLITITAALRLPLMLGLGLLTGLQKQVTTNAIILGCNILRALAAIGMILWFDAGPVGFFAAQLAGTVIELLLAQIFAWRSPIGAWHRARVDFSSLKGRWHFSAGVAYISLSAALMAHVDRLIISGAVPLETFGYYAVSMTIAVGLVSMVYPATIAVNPELTALKERNEMARATRLYRTFTQLILVMCAPIALTLIVGGEGFLQLYLREGDKAAAVLRYFPQVMIGSLCAALVPLAHTVQIAFGQTGYIGKANTLYVIAYFPALFFILPLYGLEIQLYIYAAFQFLYALAILIWSARVALQSSIRDLVLRDIFVPILIGLPVVVLTHRTLAALGFGQGVTLGLTYLVTALAILACCGLAWEKLRAMRVRKG